MNRRTLLSTAAAGAAIAPFAAARAAIRSREIMGLGWYVVFSPPSMTDDMTSFYGDTLGLPLMMTMRTPDQNKNYFWCGEDIVLDLSHHAPEGPFDPRDADPATARQVPIFRTENLDALMATFAARGARTLPARPTALGREAFVVDPTGQLAREVDADRNLGDKLGLHETPTIVVVTPKGWIQVRDVSGLYQAIDKAEAMVATTAEVRHSR